MNKLQTVPLSEKYIAAAAKMEKECFSSPWTEDGLRAELTSDTAVFRVVLLNDSPAGYGGMHFVCGEGYIDNIAVLPQYRRCGVGSAALRSLLDFAWNNNGSFVSLEVRKSNTPALALYHSFGFKKAGLRKNFYSNPTEDALILTVYKT